MLVRAEHAVVAMVCECVCVCVCMCAHVLHANISSC